MRRRSISADTCCGPPRTRTPSPTSPLHPAPRSRPEAPTQCATPALGTVVDCFFLVAVSYLCGGQVPPSFLRLATLALHDLQGVHVLGSVYCWVLRSRRCCVRNDSRSAWANKCDELSTRLQHNGDDIIRLIEGNADANTVLDKFGTEGTRTRWTICGVASASAERGLIRKPAVVSGTTDWDASRGILDLGLFLATCSMFPAATSTPKRRV